MSAGIPVATDSTHAPRLANRVSTAYQKARVNVFVDPSQRHQLDALAAEWGVPMVEAFRRVLALGLCGVMHHDTG